MRHNPKVLYVKRNIIINPTFPDLGHPELPGLLDELKSKPNKEGTLKCLGDDCLAAEIKGAGPQWVYLKYRPRVRSIHLNPSRNGCSGGESDLHKRFKDGVVKVLEERGFTARQEVRSGNHVRSDVEADGPVKTSVEIELKEDDPNNVVKRSRFRQARGLQDLWISDNPSAAFNYRVPSAATRPTTSRRVAEGLNIRVVEGIRISESVRCGDRGPRCPLTDRRPCGLFHVELTPVQGRDIDELIVGVVAGDFRNLQVKVGRNVHNFWLPVDDWKRYTEDRQIGDAEPTPESDTEPVQFQRPQDLTDGCSRSSQPPRAVEVLDARYKADGSCWCGRDGKLKYGRWLPIGWFCDAHYWTER